MNQGENTVEDMNKDLLLVVESAKSPQEVERSFSAAAGKHKFGVLGVHNLRQKMNEKGVAFEQDCLVLEVCNPQQAKRILGNDLSISTVLPCRVSVYQVNGRTRLATIRPTALLELFAKPELRLIAREVEESMFEMMKEAAA